MNFEIYPAIDLRRGKVVRLQKGDPNRQTDFGDNPAATAERWVAAGANWLHVVNLDGAFDEQGAANWVALESLTGRGALVQFGGGLRTLKDIARALNRGVRRVVLGTIAIEEPELVAEAVDHFGPDRVAVGLDARGGLINTHGWQAATGVSAIDLGREMVALGIRIAIHTDIERDGVLAGVNVDSTAGLARATGLGVIASGGVHSLEDIEQLLKRQTEGIVGVIIGRALYDGRVDLAQALELVTRAQGAG